MQTNQRHKNWSQSSVGSKNQGFTLLELLVALVIFAVISALAYRSLTALIQTRARIQEQTTRWRETMLFFNRLNVDLRRNVNRPVANEASMQPAWLAKRFLANKEDVQLQVSRLGSPEQNGNFMDTQRIGYRYRAGNVELLLWPALDVESYQKPKVYILLSGVKSLSFRYMQHKTHQWVSDWPTSIKEDVIPKAVQVDLVLDTGEQLNRIYHLQ